MLIKEWAPSSISGGVCINISNGRHRGTPTSVSNMEHARERTAHAAAL